MSQNERVGPRAPLGRILCPKRALRGMSPDTFLAALGIAIGGLVMVFSAIWGLRQEDLGFVVLVAGAVYLVVRGKAVVHTPATASPRIPLLLSFLLFAVLLACGLLLVHGSQYERPPAFFLVVGLLAGVVGFQVHLARGLGGFIVGLLTVEATLLCLLVRWSAFYALPTIPGNDTLFHAGAAGSVAREGSLAGGFTVFGFPDDKYVDFPVLHVFLAQLELVCGVSSKGAVFVVGTVSSLVGALCVGSLARRLVGALALPIAAVLFGLADMVLVLTLTNLNPGVLVLAYGSVLLVCVWQTSDARVVALGAVIVVVTVLAHQLTAFALLVLVSGMWCGSWVASQPKCWKTPVEVNHGVWPSIRGAVVVFFGIVTAAVWLFHGGVGTETSFGGQMIMRLWLAMQDPLIDPSGAPYVVGLGQYSLYSTVMFHAGYLLLVFLGAIGLLWFAQRRSGRSQGMAMVVGLLIILAVTYLSPLTGLKQAMIPHRFLPIAYLLLAPAACAGLLWLASLFRDVYRRSAFTAVVMALFAFLMVTTPFVAWDTLYNQTRAFRNGLMTSEVKAMSQALTSTNGSVASDAAYLAKLRSLPKPSNADIEAMRFGDRMVLLVPVEGSVLVREALAGEEALVAGRATFGGGTRALVGQWPLAEVESRVAVGCTYRSKEVSAYGAWRAQTGGYSP